MGKLNYCLLIPVFIGVLLPVLSRYHFSTGTLPILHIGVPYGYNYADIGDLKGKSAIVTGANSGLGFGTAKLLAHHGADVVLACRSIAKAEDAIQEIRASGPVTGTLRAMALDLSVLASVKEFVSAVKALDIPLNILALNAGIMANPYTLTKDGIESQFQVNFLGHYGLARSLLPLLKENTPARVVVVASLAHYFAPPEGVHLSLEKLNNETMYDEQAWYGQSNLARVLFAREFSRRLTASGEDGIYVNSIHPGGVKGKLLRHMLAGMQWLEDLVQDWLYWDQETGALTLLRPALDSSIEQDGIRGQYFVPIGRLDPGSEQSRDMALAARVWDFAEQLLAKRGFALPPV